MLSPYAQRTPCEDMTSSRGTRTTRVVHIDLGLEYRGGQRQVLYLATEQLKTHYDVLLACPHHAPLAQLVRSQGLAHLSLPSRYGLDPRNLHALLRMLQPGDIVHTHEARAASLGAMTFLSWKMYSAAPVHLVHTRRVSYALGHAWSRWKYQQGHVACVSREVEDVVRHAGVRQTSVIPSAIAVERYTARRTNNNGRVGIIGALSPQKGHAQFFAALACLEHCPEVWIIGTGALEGSLRDQARALGIDGRLVWKGYVDSAEVLPHVDIIVVPSAHGEGSSGVIKEAWAAHVPVICSDLPANLELVRHNYNGLVFRNGDPSDLAAQLHTVANTSQLAIELVQHGLRSLAPFTTQAMHAAYDQLYARIAA